MFLEREPVFMVQTFEYLAEVCPQRKFQKLACLKKQAQDIESNGICLIGLDQLDPSMQ